MDALYRGRDWFASLPSILVVVAILMFSAQTVLPPKKEVVLPPMEISLAPPPEPEPPRPVTAEPPPPTPVKPVEPRPQPAAKPVAAPQSAPPVAATPSTSEPATVPAAPSAPARPAEAVPEAPPAPPAPRNTQSTESTYVGKVRAYLDATKRYPTGREASSLRPRGLVKVWFVLSRTGEALDVGIESSSGSTLIDNAALASVRRGRFPPFPDDAWPGQGTQRFTAELNFIPPE